MAQFPAVAWFREFARDLEDDDAFQRSMRHFDGSIRLEIGSQTIWMKIYRGQVLEVLEQEAEFGTTFAISGPPEEWERLVTDDRNPFGEQQTLGKLVISGNVLESTRLIDGINAMVDRLRAETGTKVTVPGGEAR